MICHFVTVQPCVAALAVCFCFGFTLIACVILAMCLSICCINRCLRMPLCEQLHDHVQAPACFCAGLWTLHVFCATGNHVRVFACKPNHVHVFACKQLHVFECKQLYVCKQSHVPSPCASLMCVWSCDSMKRSVTRECAVIC